jgi:hypothetical protein
MIMVQFEVFRAKGRMFKSPSGLEQMVEKGHRKGPKTKDQWFNFSIQLPTIPFYIVPDCTLPFSITIIITLFRARDVAYLLPKIHLFFAKRVKRADRNVFKITSVLTLRLIYYKSANRPAAILLQTNSQKVLTQTTYRGQNSTVFVKSVIRSKSFTRASLRKKLKLLFI